MQESTSQQIIQEPTARVAKYQEMILAYYARVTQTYLKQWGESFHLALFSGAETLREALDATERAIANEGGFCSGMNILDVGCGVGGPALNIAAYSGSHITGIDLVPEHIQIAHQRALKKGLADRTDFVCADGMNIPFADASFDAVYIFDAGCYMPDKPAFYKECARVLRPGGVFLGLDLIVQEGLSAEEEAKYIEPICRYQAIPHLINLGELHQCLTSAGFVVKTIENATELGNVLRNWEIINNHVFKYINGILLKIMPPNIRLLINGGNALLAGAKAGVFMMGYWYAYKPSVGEEVG